MEDSWQTGRDGLMDRWVIGWKRWVEGWKNGWVDGWMNGWVQGLMDDRWTDRKQEGY